MAARHAILIGVDGYRFRPLASAVNDAVAFRNALLGRGEAQLPPIFTESEITLLNTPGDGNAPSVAGKPPATHDAILDALKPHYDGSEPASFLLVYFAGHGLVASRDGRVRETFILPSDVRAPDDGRNMISVTELLALFAERGPLQQLWIIDACRDMPYEKRPRGYEIPWTDQPAQLARGQVAIFAVAQGGTAMSEAGGHGRFTQHLLNGLTGQGSAADFLPGKGYCVTAQSLHAYARRQIEKALVGYDDWTRTVQMTQLSQSGDPLDPLRMLTTPPPRAFTVTVQPPEASAAIEYALEVQAGIPVPDWPPTALPRIYELRAWLRPGANTDGWGNPQPTLSAVDLREQDTATIKVPRAAAAPSSLELQVVTNDVSETGEAQTSTRKLGTRALRHVDGDTATLTVAAKDAVARVQLRRVEPPWNEHDVAPNTPIDLEAGAWDVTITLGDQTIGSTRVVLSGGESRTVEAVPQITAAVAALLAKPQGETSGRPRASTSSD